MKTAPFICVACFLVGTGLMFFLFEYLLIPGKDAQIAALSLKSESVADQNQELASLRGKLAVLENARPHFAEKESGISVSPLPNLKDQAIYSMDLKLTNNGQHGATNLTTNVLCMPQTLTDPPGVKLANNDANEIPSGGPIVLSDQIKPLGPDVPPQFIYLQIRYEDSESENGKLYSQDWCLSWEGAKDGYAKSNFNSVSAENKLRILNYVRRQGVQIFSDPH